MKKILIFSHAMEIGGAERALLGLLENIDTTKYDVDLFLMRHSGELMQYIPPNINLLPEISQYASLAVPITEVLKKGQYRVALGRLRGKLKAKKRIAELELSAENDVALEYSHKYTLNVMPQVSSVEYDLAIGFLTPHYFLAEKTRAKKKVAWIHTDYAAVRVDTDSELKMWNKYDVIASISDDVTRSFLKTFPSLAPKVQVIGNILPVKYIEELSEEFSTEQEMPDGAEIKLLSVGRFCLAKNFDNVPYICKMLRDKGIDVKWYLIGYGGDEPSIRRKISEAEMEDYVIILGKRDNPYPYIKKCDIYVQPSRYEGKCVAVIEAQILNKPVIITNYETSSSQLINGYDGVIVPMDNEKCAEEIARVIGDRELQQRLIENTKKNDYSNAREIEKVYRMMES